MIFHSIIDTMLPNRHQHQNRTGRIMPIELPGRNKEGIEFPVEMPLRHFPGLEEILTPGRKITEIDLTRPSEIKMPEDSQHALYIIG
jgi:hypothetical protein